MKGTPTPLPRFLTLYAALFAAYGVVSPFFGAFLASRNLLPEAIGLVLAAGTAMRLAGGPIGGRLADRLKAPRAVLTCCTAMSAAVAFAYLPANGLLQLLLVSVTHALVLAPITPIADALALEAAKSSASSRFEYGWVRGAGSAAFILGTLLAGGIVAQWGLSAVIWLNGMLLATAAWAASRVPDLLQHPIRSAPAAQGNAATENVPDGGLATLLRLAPFRRLMVVAALIQGSHALHDGFVVIHWRGAGIDDGTIGLLWSESVAAEVVVFLFIGRWLLDKLTPAGASVLAAASGVLRWVVLATTTSAAAAAMVEPLHGFTFALQHLACMRLIGDIVPPRLAATAQAFYGTVAIGVASALLTLGSGPLYSRFGSSGFWFMACLCGFAIPLAARLRG